MAERLVSDEVLTVYQAKRFLNNKPHGLLVGRYIILDRIGSGSMGRVYKAHHQMMDRIVALKIIAPEIASNEKVVARFQREMKLVGRLDHPHVVRAFDADRINRTLYIVMEYVPGLSLGDRLKKGPIPASEMIDYAAQAALGLAHAHEQGMVHRDIKPSNMLLTRDRKIKILDLGLGLLLEADSNATFATADGIAVGTVDYMSPEQALGRDVDGRSDLFSLGCAMYHLMTRQARLPRRVADRPAGQTHQREARADHGLAPGPAATGCPRPRQADGLQAAGPILLRDRGLRGPPEPDPPQAPRGGLGSSRYGHTAGLQARDSRDSPTEARRPPGTWRSPDPEIPGLVPAPGHGGGEEAEVGVAAGPQLRGGGLRGRVRVGLPAQVIRPGSGPAAGQWWAPEPAGACSCLGFAGTALSVKTSRRAPSRSANLKR